MGKIQASKFLFIFIILVALIALIFAMQADEKDYLKTNQEIITGTNNDHPTSSPKLKGPSTPPTP